MKNSLALLLLLFSSLHAWTLDEVFSPNVSALFKADVIVTCTIEPGEDLDYHIHVLNVLKNHSPVEVENKDRIKIKGSYWSGFGNKANKHAEAYVLYLRYYQRKWHTYTSQHQYPLKKGNIPFYICNSVFYLNVRDYRIMRKQVLKNFEYEERCAIEPVISEEEYKKGKTVLPVVSFLYKKYQYICQTPYEGENEVAPIDYEPDFQDQEDKVYEFFDIAPDFVDGTEAYWDYINRAIPDSIMNNPYGIEGKFYVRFVVEKDSSLTQFEVVRTLYKPYNQAIIEALKGIPPIYPGIVDGRAVRSRFIVPVTIKRDQ